jgi:hypothetical protein
MASSVTIMPYMMMPGDASVVARVLHDILSNPPKVDAPPTPSGDTQHIAGTWQGDVQFVRGSASHRFVFEQDGEHIKGTHSMAFLSANLQGSVSGAQVRFQSSHRYEGKVLAYTFQGAVHGETIEGEVSLGEYGTAKWRARRTA